MINRLPQFVGTAKCIADQMETFIDTVGGDGFMLSPIYCPGAIERFVDEVVPELQRRGRMRSEYAGTTLRDSARTIRIGPHRPECACRLLSSRFGCR